MAGTNLLGGGGGDGGGEVDEIASRGAAPARKRRERSMDGRMVRSGRPRSWVGCCCAGLRRFCWARLNPANAAGGRFTGPVFFLKGNLGPFTMRADEPDQKLICYFRSKNNNLLLDVVD